jgi:lysylphosphatidylglycerol synthetase-like protein (DUF2156 family)
MSQAKSWSVLGQYPAHARTNFFGIAYSVIIASETFSNDSQRYQLWLSAVILLTAIFIAKRAFTSGAILGVATAVFSLVWIGTFFNPQLFYTIDLWFMLSHSFLAIAVAVAASSYLKS